jgi:uncharacterized protein YjbI with pentapeptide repeats
MSQRIPWPRPNRSRVNVSRLLADQACAEGVTAFDAMFPDGIDDNWAPADQLAALQTEPGRLWLAWFWRHNLLPQFCMAGASLAGANLHRADLVGVELARADLRGVDLALANLERASLRGANLAGATLAGANLTGADLAGADLRGANLTGAQLGRADFRGATWDDKPQVHGASFAQRIEAAVGLPAELRTRLIGRRRRG